MATAVVLELIDLDGEMPIARAQRDGMIIGRAAAVDVPITDPSASREHARLNRRGDHFEIENLSPNGTLVNGKSISSRILKDGDVIQIGESTRLKVRYLTQTGAVIGHDAGSGEGAALPAFENEDDAAAPPPAPAPARPSLL